MTCVAQAQHADTGYEAGGRWRLWSPYPGERRWGTVRESRSEPADGWFPFPRKRALMRAYCRGKDGLSGFYDATGAFTQIAVAMARLPGTMPWREPVRSQTRSIRIVDGHWYQRSSEEPTGTGRLVGLEARRESLFAAEPYRG